MSFTFRVPFLSHSIGFPFATISRKFHEQTRYVSFCLNQSDQGAFNHKIFLLRLFINSYVPIIGPMLVDDFPNQRGGISYLRQGVKSISLLLSIAYLHALKLGILKFQEADLHLGAMVGTSERFKDADFSSPWISRPFSILIPIPNSSTNIGALIQPMSTSI